MVTGVPRVTRGVPPCSRRRPPSQSAAAVSRSRTRSRAWLTLSNTWSSWATRSTPRRTASTCSSRWASLARVCQFSTSLEVRPTLSLNFLYWFVCNVGGDINSTHPYLYFFFIRPVFYILCSSPIYILSASSFQILPASRIYTFFIFSAVPQNSGGSTNAHTDCEQTAYYFDVNSPHLREALDRFAQFFISPLMRKDSMQRERQAVENGERLPWPATDTRCYHFAMSRSAFLPGCQSGK